MSRVAQPREGDTLRVKGRVLPFSFFPVTRGNRRFGLFDVLFAVSPWAIMRGAINDQVRDPGERAEALAFLEQAQDFYEAAADRMAANPLLYYYAFVNLGKALLRTRGFPGSLDQAMHGLSERRTGVGKELANSIVIVQDSRNDVVNIYPELVERLGFPRPTHGDTYEVPLLMPQVVVGHRLWKEAARRTERFLSLSEIEIVDDRAAKELWLRLYLPRGDLRRYGITHKQLLEESAIAVLFREVDVQPTGRGSGLVCFEQKTATPYTGRPTDVVQGVVDDTRGYLWRIVSSRPTDGYRRYYLSLTPPGELSSRMPQLASLWALFFYFGSVVRYRPQMFDAMSGGTFGAVVTEFVSAQPGQLLYLLASEMCRREVARPAIV
jgi:hypothetical protein